MLDFTLRTLNSLLSTLIQQGFIFHSYSQFIKSHGDKVVILRHDVDLMPANSLLFASVQNNLGIRGTYYFRVVPESWNEKIINEIATFGHEIGYHYETMDTVYKKIKDKSKTIKVRSDDLVDLAYEEFCKNLEYFRKVYPVKTICMHGSPYSRFDNREIWKKYNYRELGIIGEPYFDLNFDEVFYLTDTGRCWDGFKLSLRDKVPQQEQWIKQGFVFKTTRKIITSARHRMLPDQMMITLHPQRWTNKPIPWIKELVIQNSKNIVKYSMIKVKQKK